MKPLSILCTLGCLVYASTLLSAQDLKRGQQVEGKIVRVTDGDTVWLEMPDKSVVHRLRLSSADCPEKDQPRGKEARDFTTSKALGNTAKAIILGKSYDRYVAVVEIKGKSLTDLLVEAGWAWVDTRYAKGQEAKRLQELERKAKESHKGIWQDSKPIEPWQWRKGKR